MKLRHTAVCISFVWEPISLRGSAKFHLLANHHAPCTRNWRGFEIQVRFSIPVHIWVNSSCVELASWNWKDWGMWRFVQGIGREDLRWWCARVDVTNYLPSRKLYRWVGPERSPVICTPAGLWKENIRSDGEVVRAQTTPTSSRNLLSLEYKFRKDLVCCSFDKL